MISVVIPLYNKEHSVSATLHSVTSQTYTDFEVLVINDGSTDNSAQMVEKVALADSRIKLINKPNGGVSSARNVGMQNAKSDFVCFLDSDDFWDKHFLDEMSKLIENFPDATIYGLACGAMLNGVKSVATNNLPDNFRGILNNVWILKPYFFTSSSACVNKKITLELGGFDTRMTHGEDLDMWWRLLLSGDGVFYNKTLAWYVQDAENRAMNRVIPLEKHIPYYIDKYADARANNISFRKFFDDEMARRLYPYLFNHKYKKQAKQLLNKIDWSLQKKSLRLRMFFPHIYDFWKNLRKI